MKIHVSLPIAIAAVLASSAALADDKSACLDAVTSGQHLRDAHKLVAARDQFRICAAAQCPAVVQSDCAAWLEKTETALPEVVLSARDAAGADLFEVNVSVDGQPFVAKLDGKAVPMDPGPHVFHFAKSDGAAVDRQVLIREGDQSQIVAVTFGAPAPSSPAPLSPRADSAPSPGSSTWNTVGWVLGGIGLVGIGVGSVFGAMAISDNNSAHCNASKQCEPGPLGDARNAAVVSDIGLIAGGVLVASGLALVLFGPSGRSPDGVTARLAPVVGAGTAGLMAGGTF